MKGMPPELLWEFEVVEPTEVVKHLELRWAASCGAAANAPAAAGGRRLLRRDVVRAGGQLPAIELRLMAGKRALDFQQPAPGSSALGEPRQALLSGIKVTQHAGFDMSLCVEAGSLDTALVPQRYSIDKAILLSLSLRVLFCLRSAQVSLSVGDESASSELLQGTVASLAAVELKKGTNARLRWAQPNDAKVIILEGISIPTTSERSLFRACSECWQSLSGCFSHSFCIGHHSPFSMLWPFCATPMIVCVRSVRFLWFILSDAAF
jgi:hypothetical protein